MSDFGWAVIENIALITAVCFLVWLTNNGWWALLCLGLNQRVKK